MIYDFSCTSYDMSRGVHVPVMQPVNLSNISLRNFCLINQFVQLTHICIIQFSACVVTFDNILGAGKGRRSRCG